MDFYHFTGSQIELRIMVSPQSSSDQVVGVVPDPLYPIAWLKISLKARPIAGEANRALLVYLSKIFEIPLKRITLSKGSTHQRKKVIFEKMGLAQFEKCLNAVLPCAVFNTLK